ncbi:MAG: caspase family protein, partial [Planctomycetes bacterium]|nr:caspase family protein [Planctomycetota bacterium]
MRCEQRVLVIIASVMIATAGNDHSLAAKPGGKGVNVESDARSGSDTTGRKWAVVVGVNFYLDRTIPSLKYAVADAELIAETLVKKCGYDKDNLLVLTDKQPETLKPGLINLQAEMPRFLSKPAAGDTVFVFFSGHGFTDKGGQTYLAPRDCRRKALALSALRVDQVSNWLKQCKAKRKILVLDCCHAGGKNIEATGSSSEQISEAFRDAAGLITLASCKRDEKSFEWEEKRHGLFTYFLVEGLSGAADVDKNRIVDSDELYKYVWKKVPDQASRMADRQTPVRHIPRDTEGVFELARLERRIVTPRKPIVTPLGKLALSFSVRANSSSGKLLEGAKVSLLYRASS